MSHFPVGTTIELVINSFFTNDLIQIETFKLLNLLLKIFYDFRAKIRQIFAQNFTLILVGCV